MNTETHSPTEKPAAAAPRTTHGPDARRQGPTPNSRHDVMNALLGKSKLSASDLAGDDPYNNTGKFFRR